MDYTTVATRINSLRSDSNIDVTLNATRPKAVDVQLLLFDIFIPILAILIITFNLAIVISSGLILYKGQQPRSTYIFLGNVALSDLLTGLAVVFGQYYPHQYRDELTCAIQTGMTVSSALASVYSIGLIGIDRYLYILYGLQYQRYIYANRARIMTLMTWVLALTIGFLPAMGVRGDTDNGKLCWFIIVTPQPLVLATAIIGIIPLIVIMILYSIILREALKKIADLKKATISLSGTNTGSLRLFRGGQQVQNSPLSVIEDTTNSIAIQDHEEPLNRKQSIFRYLRRKSSKIKMHKTPSVYNPSKWKAVKIVLYTTGSYLLTWGPFFIASSLYSMCNPDDTPVYCDNLRIAIASPLAILGFCNSLLNPLIYAWWHNGFRESFKKIFNGKCCQSDNSVTEISTPRNMSNKRRNLIVNMSRDAESSEGENRPIGHVSPVFQATNHDRDLNHHSDSETVVR